MLVVVVLCGNAAAVPAEAMSAESDAPVAPTNAPATAQTDAPSAESDAPVAPTTAQTDEAAPGIPAVADYGIRGVIPRVRLFCSPCFDRYAQEIWPRSMRWEREPVGWRRENGALVISRPAEDSMLLIDGSPFDPATVYVFYRERWWNLAILMDLPAERALPTLEGYIRVERVSQEVQ